MSQEMSRLPQGLFEQIPIRHETVTRKRIGCNVEDAHHVRAGAPLERVVSDLEGGGFHKTDVIASCRFERSKGGVAISTYHRNLACRLVEIVSPRRHGDASGFQPSQ